MNAIQKNAKEKLGYDAADNHGGQLGKRRETLSTYAILPGRTGHNLYHTLPL